MEYGRSHIRPVEGADLFVQEWKICEFVDIAALVKSKT